VQNSVANLMGKGKYLMVSDLINLINFNERQS
jgi:hypothetical protein